MSKAIGGILFVTGIVGVLVFGYQNFSDTSVDSTQELDAFLIRSTNRCLPTFETSANLPDPYECPPNQIAPSADPVKSNSFNPGQIAIGLGDNGAIGGGCTSNVCSCSNGMIMSCGEGFQATCQGTRIGTGPDAGEIECRLFCAKCRNPGNTSSCGDGACNGGETQFTCAVDCTPCFPACAPTQYCYNGVCRP